MYSNGMKRLRNWSLVLLILGIVVGGFLVIPDANLYVDEVVHHAVIQNFCNLRGEISAHLTNIPAYHGTVALLCYLGSWFLQFDSLAWVRVLSLGLGLAGLWIIYKTAEELGHERPDLKVLQVFFLPVSYTFFFLVYTDIPALMLVILGLYLTLKKKYMWAGLVATLSVAFRQNNIVWLGWLAVLVYLQEYGWRLSLGKVLTWMRKVWVFVLGTLGFGAFVYLNGGISLAEAEAWAHPAFSLYVGNIYLMLLYFLVVFLPEFFLLVRKSWEGVREKMGWFIGALILLLGVYVLRFENTHPYNQHVFSLHNMVLVEMVKSKARMIWAFVPMALAVFMLFARRLKERKYYLMYLFAVLFVLPSWLIEPRYYIVPFSLYLLLRVEEKAKNEWIILGWEALLAVGILVLTAAKVLFP